MRVSLFRMDSVNGGPVVEFRLVSRVPLIVERRYLSPDGEEWGDGSSAWAQMPTEDLLRQLATQTPMGRWLVLEWGPL